MRFAPGREYLFEIVYKPAMASTALAYRVQMDHVTCLSSCVQNNIRRRAADSVADGHYMSCHYS
jgi:hypothetical protein